MSKQTLQHYRKIYGAQLLGLILFFGYFVSCSNDDNDLVSIPERDRAEQQIADNDSLLNYFANYYFNADELEAIGQNVTLNDIVIDSLTGDLPAGSRMLIDELNDPNGKLETHTATIFETDYTYYILRLNQGGGSSNPSSAADVRVRYEGFLEDDTVFDDTAINIPTEFDLLNVVPGWRLVLPQFNIAESFSTNNTNGSVTYENYGVGVMFLPSGLGYFSSPPPGGGISVYTNIIFKFELLQTEENDHDADGVLSYLEDLNNNTDYFDDNTDEDNFANVGDPDDDGDGVATANENTTAQYQILVGDPEPTLGTNEYEVSRSQVGNLITINTVTLIDSNNDGVFDYLDAEIAEDNSVN